MERRWNRWPAAALQLMFLLAPACVASAAAPASAPMPPGEARAQAFLAILKAPVEQQRRFVQDNFSQSAIERRGLDGLVAFLAQVHKDLGDAPPRSVRALGGRVEYGIHSPAGEDLRFSVMLTPPPESKINGFTLEPDPTAEPAPSVPAAELPTAIAAVMAQHKDFTGEVVVGLKGQPIFAQAYGEADRAVHRAMTLDTPINLASNNKMFTAVVIARLVEQGKLDWSDTVGKFLPDWPQAEVRDKVSIENLLTHTSGLGDYWGAAQQAKSATLDTVAEYAELFRDDKPAAQPGKQFKYSNNGYVLLGLIAEKVTGKDYYQLVRELVYRPAGMSHSDHYLNTDTASGFALGYDADQSPNTGRLALRGSPAGGGYATAGDMLRFATALEDGKLVGKDTLARMTTGYASMGEQMGYGYGFGVTAGKEKHYGHEGGTPGTNASFEVFPESGYVVVVMSNTGQGSHDVAQQLIGLVLARK